MKDKFSLQGKTALITGAGRGIGEGIARLFAAYGAHVTLLARTENEIKPLAKELNGDYITCDVTNTSDFTSKIKAYDIFVNNAGMNRPQPFLEVSEENFDAVTTLNLRAAFFAAQAVAKAMVQSGKGGSIINMSSQMGLVGAANRSVYCASKHALEGLTKVMAIELAPHTIRTNTLCPTFVETPMTKPFFENEAFKQSVLSKIKLGKLAQIDDVAAACLFLASDASKMMTGTHLLIDGGWTAD